MSKINKLTTSFIKITNALDKVRTQDENNIYVSMLDEEELECLKYVQRLRTYAHRQLSASPTDTDESKPEKKKWGRKKKAVQGEVIDVEIGPPSPDESPEIWPLRPLIVLYPSHMALCRMIICYFISNFSLST